MLGIVKYEASKKLPTPRDGLFNGFLFLLFILFHIFFTYITLLGLCGQLNKANKTLPLTLLKI